MTKTENWDFCYFFNAVNGVQRRWQPRCFCLTVLGLSNIYILVVQIFGTTGYNPLCPKGLKNEIKNVIKINDQFKICQKSTSAMKIWMTQQGWGIHEWPKWDRRYFFCVLLRKIVITDTKWPIESKLLFLKLISDPMIIHDD